MPLPLLPPASSLEITPATVASRVHVAGPYRLGTDQLTISPATVASDVDVPGPQPMPLPETRRPIRPMTVHSAVRVPGPMVLLASSELASIPAGPGRVSKAITVKGYPYATAIDAQPQLNDLGRGTFTATPPRPAEDEIVGFDVGGRRVFTGLASRITDVKRAASEEAGQLVTTEADGMLAEFDRVLVLPDFGAADLSRLGPPTQDTRHFDWTMNGLGTDDPADLPPPRLISSVAMATDYGTATEVFPLPDVWPAPYARWMWVANPRLPQPRGFCHFRIPFGVPKASTHRIQVWCCAYDQAEVWLDGVPILTCDTPGVAQRVELVVRSDFHNLTIKAYNDRGHAGLLVAIMPVTEDGLYGEPLRTSGSGWSALAYPARTFRLNPGQVMRRLHAEATSRRTAFVPDWRLDFSATRDSAGRPWPVNDEISVQVGSTMLDVLRQLSESLVDFAAAPAGRILRMWVKDKGTGKHRTSPWTDGVDLTSRAVRRVVR